MKDATGSARVAAVSSGEDGPSSVAATAVVSPSKDDGKPRLPTELLLQIVDLACVAHPSNAHTFAYVSRALCAWTAGARFRTVTLTTPRSAARFWLLLELQHALPIVCGQWRLPLAFARATTVRALDVHARCFEEAETSSDARTRKILRDEFGCSLTQQLSTEVKSAAEWTKEGLTEAESRATRFACCYWREYHPPQGAPDPSIEGEELIDHGFTSLPTDRPIAEYVENLLIDIEPCNSGGPDALAAEGRSSRAPDEAQNIFELSERLEALRERIASSLSLLLQHNYDAPWSLVQKVAQLPVRHGHRLCHLLDRLPRLVRLSLGGAEMEALSDSFHTRTLTPRELTLVYHGNEESLEALVRPGPDAAELDDEWIGVGIGGAATAKPGRSRATAVQQGWHLKGVRHRLDKLHIIGIDPRSPLTGIPLPGEQLDALRAGSFAQHSFLRLLVSVLEQQRRQREQSGAQADDPHSRDRLSWRKRQDCAAGVRFLRYDTRKFGLRPVEVTATKLRHFIRELRDSPGPIASPPSAKDGDARSAAPMAQDVLHEWGAGTFAKLQLAWSTPDDAAKLNAARRAPDSNGGWPRERKGAWTERSERDVVLTFGHELVETLRQTLGWAQLPQWESAFLDDLRHASDDERMLTDLRALARSVDEVRAEEHAATSAPLTPTVVDTFDLRRPASFMRFEGTAAFEKEERVRLFLDAAAGGKSAWA